MTDSLPIKQKNRLSEKSNSCTFQNLFQDSVPFLCPLKTLENQRLTDIFWSDIKWGFIWNELVPLRPHPRVTLSKKTNKRREEEGFVVSCEIYSSVVFILKLWFGFESENLAVRISLYCNRYPEYFWLEVSNASPTRHLLTPPPKLHEKIADWLISVRYETLALTLLVPSPERKIKKVIFLFSHFFVVPQKVLWRQGLYFNTTIRNARDGKG